MVSVIVSFFRALAGRSCFPIFLCTLSTTAAYAQLPADVSNGTFSWSHCRILEEEQLFERLNAVTQAVFQGDERSHGTINAIDRELSRGWIEHNGDAVIDAAVSAGADRILAEEGRGYVILSGWSMKKANKIVLTLSYYVLDSTDVRELVTTLAAYAAKALEPILIETLARSAHAGVACLEEFTRNSFPAALNELFGQYLEEGDNSGITMASADIIGFSLSDLLQAHRLAAAGVVAVVAAQIVARIAPMLLSRLGAGIVAATVPILGWTIGVTLVVSDLIVNLDGALGIAEETLTAAETKKDMRHQLRETILEEMRRQTAGIALAVAEETYHRYLEFTNHWKRLLFWSESNAYFHRFLELAKVRDMVKLTELIGMLERKLDVEEMNNMINSGDLERMFSLPQESYTILETVEDPRQLLEWAELAGTNAVLVQVVERELYRVSDPGQFESRTHLKKVLNLELSLNDARRVMMLGQHMTILLELPTEDSREIVAKSRQHDDLVWLLPFLSGMSSGQTNQTVDRILRYPVLLRKLESENVRNALMNSSDFSGYLDFMAQPSGQSTADRAVRIVNEIDGLITGRVSRELFFEKYRGHILGAVAVAAFVLMWKIGKWRRELARDTRRKRVAVDVGE